MAEGKKTVVVLFGGMSSEHEVSCLSAASILRNIDRDKYKVRSIGITKEGRWWETSSSPEDIASGAWEKNADNRSTYISPDRSVHGLHTDMGSGIYVDCVFSVLHGQYGEDGCMQGLLEMSGIPYVGPGVLASSCAMDKVTTKYLVEREGIRQAEYYVTDQYTFATAAQEELAAIEETFGGHYPLFVKPANAGSSVGVTRVENQKALVEGILKAAEIDEKILIERAIVGRELEVAVLGNRTPHASPVGEIIAAGAFYDYEAKYGDIGSIAEVAKDLPEGVERELQETAIRVYRALGCRGLSRVDFFLAEDGVYFNEINTLPGFTNISMYPQLWEAADVAYGELIDRLIDLALEDEE